MKPKLMSDSINNYDYGSLRQTHINVIIGSYSEFMAGLVELAMRSCHLLETQIILTNLIEIRRK
ncbi:hypothetical protein SAMN05216406_11059 [Nitrosomonas ureae]|uniref:Uncharacterized protein n=2 Tax=Nitrosomonas ureae TaxID=44577 RepID=A0A1H2E9E5_9PROT|nr:hypothetical protein SAMN05216406_11059 [Nitrosomonas ureae]